MKDNDFSRGIPMCKGAPELGNACGRCARCRAPAKFQSGNEQFEALCKSDPKISQVLLALDPSRSYDFKQHMWVGWHARIDEVEWLQQRLTAAETDCVNGAQSLLRKMVECNQLGLRVGELEEVLRELLAGTGSSPGANREYGRARAVLEDSQKQAEPEPHQGIPGTSFQRLNALANQGE